MDETRAKARRRWQLLGAAALLGAVVGALAVYFMGPGNGNVVDADCVPAQATAARTAPFAKGEVAGFQVAKTPDKVTDLAFKAPDGSDVSVASFAGKMVLLNIWATWCVPCRREMP